MLPFIRITFFSAIESGEVAFLLLIIYYLFLLQNVEEGVNKTNLKFLVRAVDADEILFPWNRQKLQSQQVEQFSYSATSL